jgi:hypothetical protein
MILVYNKYRYLLLRCISPLLGLCPMMWKPNPGLDTIRNVYIPYPTMEKFSLKKGELEKLRMKDRSKLLVKIEQ